MDNVNPKGSTVGESHWQAWGSCHIGHQDCGYGKQWRALSGCSQQHGCYQSRTCHVDCKGTSFLSKLFNIAECLLSILRLHLSLLNGEFYLKNPLFKFYSWLSMKFNLI